MKKSKFVALFPFPPPDITLKSAFLGGWEHEQSEFVAHLFPRHEFQKSLFLGGCEQLNMKKVLLWLYSLVFHGYEFVKCISGRKST